MSQLPRCQMYFRTALLQLQTVANMCHVVFLVLLKGWRQGHGLQPTATAMAESVCAVLKMITMQKCVMDLIYFTARIVSKTHYFFYCESLGFKKSMIYRKL